MTYAEKLSNPKWQIKRFDILKRDKWACLHCGSKTKQWHIHHINYDPGKEPWDCDDRNLITLCKDCHETLEKRIREMRAFLAKNPKQPKYVIRPEFRPLEGGLSDTADGWHGGKKWCKEWRSRQVLPIFSPEEAERDCRICDAIADDPLACAALAACPEREVSLFATWRGVPIKARLDAACFTRGLIADLKKARDGSPAGFGRAVHEHRYLLSAAWYCRIFHLATGRWPQWAWLVAEDSAAACVTIYRPNPEQMRVGEQQMERAMDTFIACQIAKEWPGYSCGQERFLELPAWAMREHEALMLK